MPGKYDPIQRNSPPKPKTNLQKKVEQPFKGMTDEEWYKSDYYKRYFKSQGRKTMGG